MHGAVLLACVDLENHHRAEATVLRISWAAKKSWTPANPSSSVRSRSSFASSAPATTPSGESAPTISAVPQPQVAVAVLPPGADGATGTIASSDVASALELREAEEHHERGHEEHAAADADEAAERSRPQADRERADDVHGLHQNTRTAAEARGGPQSSPETARAGMRCCSAVPATTPADRGNADEEPLATSTLP